MNVTGRQKNFYASLILKDMFFLTHIFTCICGVKLAGCFVPCFFCFFSLLDKNNSLLLCFSLTALEKKRTAEHELGEEATSCMFARVRTCSFVSGCVLCLPPPSPFQRLLPPAKAFSTVVLVIWCKYPKCVSFYILYFCHHWEVLSRLCEACNSGKLTIQITTHG